jgi:hypothetical protein
MTGFGHYNFQRLVSNSIQLLCENPCVNTWPKLKSMEPNVPRTCPRLAVYGQLSKSGAP